MTARVAQLIAGAMNPMDLSPLVVSGRVAGVHVTVLRATD